MLPFQKQIEVNDLVQTKNALDDACSEKENTIGECRNEIQTLQDKLTNSDTVLVEVRVSFGLNFTKFKPSL